MVEHAASADSHSWYLLSSTSSNANNFLTIFAYSLFKISCIFVGSEVLYLTRSTVMSNKQHLKFGQLQDL